MKAVAFSIGLLFCATAAAAESSGDISMGQAGAGIDGGEVLCRTVRDTGSRLSRRRVCMTRDRWSEQDREQRRQLAERQGRNNNGTCLTGGQAAAALRSRPGIH